MKKYLFPKNLFDNNFISLAVVYILYYIILYIYNLK
jgi:hypothetical protein